MNHLTSDYCLKTVIDVSRGAVCVWIVLPLHARPTRKVIVLLYPAVSVGRFLGTKDMSHESSRLQLLFSSYFSRHETPKISVLKLSTQISDSIFGTVHNRRLSWETSHEDTWTNIARAEVFARASSTKRSRSAVVSGCCVPFNDSDVNVMFPVCEPHNTNDTTRNMWSHCDLEDTPATSSWLQDLLLQF